MRVKLAKSAGFCMGVRRAMEMVLSEANKGKEAIFTLGPLIHNKQVMDLLASKGVRTVDDPTGLSHGSIVIRAHGVTPEKRRTLKETGLRVIDATCPKVVHVQSLVRFHTKKGRTAIIVGDPEHAEVIGIVGYSRGPVYVVGTPEEIDKLPQIEKPFVVAQTTQNRETFQQVAHTVLSRFPDAVVFDTICDATSSRQAEVKSFCGNVDGLVVVGGYHSGNTRRLMEVAKAAGIPAQHVETEKDLDKSYFAEMEVVGLTAGASTPNWMIRSVAKEIEGIKGKRENPLWSALRKACRFLLFSNLFISAGAGLLCLAAELLSDHRPNWIFPTIAFCYIYAMHTLNILFDKGASAYNDPQRATFIAGHKTFLLAVGALSVTAGLIISFFQGINTFVFASALSASGLLYGIPLLPSFGQGTRSRLRIKDIPGSRSLAESLGIVAVTTMLPNIDRPANSIVVITFAGMAIFFMAFAKAGLFEIFRVQGDLIVGTESLPISLGEKRTITLLKAALLSAFATLSVGFLAGLLSGFALIMLLPVFSMFLCVLAYQHRWLYPGLTFETVSEFPFYLSGLLAASAWLFF